MTPIDTRALQRTLFRMQHDAGFAAQLRTGDAGAGVGARLGARELAWLRALDPDALAADRGGKRAAQLLRNVSSELPLTLAASGARAESGWPADFPRSAHFHRAVLDDGSLPVAFGAFAAERLDPPAHTPLAGILRLERALLAARRRPAHAASPPPPAGGFRLAPAAQLLSLPAGSFAWASALRAALDGGAPPPGAPAAADAGPPETLLLVSGPPPAPYGLRAVHVEPLSPLVAECLAQAAAGLDAAAVAAFAERHELEADEVDAVLAAYVAEGALLRG